jgi:hypothetical protein
MKFRFPLKTDKITDNNYENNQQDALCRLIYYSKSALHVSGDVFVHHQEHLNVFTVSGSIHPSWCRLAAGSNLGELLTELLTNINFLIDICLFNICF